MDFFPFGLLKWALEKWHPRSLNGLEESDSRGMGRLDMMTLRKSLLSLKIWTRANHGYQIEANRCKKYDICMQKFTTKIVSIKCKQPSVLSKYARMNIWYNAPIIKKG